VAGPTEAAERRVRDRRAPEEPAGPPSVPGPPRWMRRPSRRTLLSAGALALVLGAFGVWALYGSSWLRVERVSVDGTRVLTESRVRAAADIPLGLPLASVDEDAAERRIRRTLRRVDEVRVVRTWPQGVGVHVTERRPVLLLPEGGQDAGEKRRYVEVDARGVRFATVAQAPKGVPLLVVEPRREPAARQRFDPATLRRAAADVVTALPDRVRRDTRTVRVRSYDAVTVELTGGRTVRWGSPERGAAKAKALTAMRKAAKGATHFDVSAPSAPAVLGG
jgi:cell division protein FtsQ